MIEIRPFSSLGAFRNEWLNAKHHFSFGEYRDPKRMGFGHLRVWNDDEIAPGNDVALEWQKRKKYGGVDDGKSACDRKERHTEVVSILQRRGTFLRMTNAIISTTL